MAASLILPAATSPLKHCRSQAVSPTNYYASSSSSNINRPTKRSSVEGSPWKRRNVSTQRELGGQGCRWNPALERVQGGKNPGTCPNPAAQVPSGSRNSNTTTNSRCNNASSENLWNRKTQPCSPKTAARKKVKRGRSSKPNIRPPSPPHPISPLHPILQKAEGAQIHCDGGMLCKTRPSQERRISSAVDSGRGEELSSSCDSDSQSKLSCSCLGNSGTQSCCNPGTLVCVSCCSSSSCSDLEEDVFLDALSNFPSRDSSASTSAFVTPLSITPLSSRSQSPLAHSDPSHCHAPKQDQFLQTVADSLQQVEADRTKPSPAPDTGQDNPHDDSRPLLAATLLAGLAGDKESTGTGGFTREKQRIRPKKRLNGVVVQSPPAPGPLSKTKPSVVSSDQPRNSKRFPRNKKKKPVVFSEGTDSCDSSITSSDAAAAVKKSHHSLGVPNDGCRPTHGKKSHKSTPQINFEASSSASPSSSVCSHSPQTLSPSPTSSFTTADHTLAGKILASRGSNLGSGREEAVEEKKKEETTAGEDKDEWPDLGMECGILPTPKPPESQVHLHLDVEARSLEESWPDFCDGGGGAEREDSGCSMSVGSSGDSCVGGYGHQPLEQLLTPPYPVAPAGHCYPGDVLSPHFSDPHLQSQQYLWVQSQRLNTFIQQHKENQERQTDEQIFYPMDPVPEPPSCSLHPPPPDHVHPPLTPLFQHLLPFSPPRPLFFSAHPPHDPHRPLHRAVERTELSEDLSYPPPPPPPPPPPLPVHPYHPALCSKWTTGFKVECVMSQDEMVSSSQDQQSSCAQEDSLCSEEEYEYHRLHESWVMWYDKIKGTNRNQCTDYKASLSHVLAVSSIEEFWQLHNNVTTPDVMEQNSDFLFFKRGIEPLWEHPANQDGGKWVLTVKNDSESLAKSWLEVLLLLIGGCVEKCGRINGAVVSRRKKGDRISLWTNTRKEKPNLDICVHLVNSVLLAYGVKAKDTKSFVGKMAEGKSGLSLVFMHHQDSLKSGHSFQNDARILLFDHLDVILQRLKILNS